LFRKIAHKAVSYNILIALAASAASHLTILRINEQNNVVLIATIFFATLAIYNFPRLPLQMPLTSRTWVCLFSILATAILIFNYNYIAINRKGGFQDGIHIGHGGFGPVGRFPQAGAAAACGQPDPGRKKIRQVVDDPGGS